MESFCGGEALWNTSRTWGNDQTYPGFSECFQNSVLIWISSGWMLSASIFYLPYLLNLKSNALPSNWKNVTKMLIGLLQLIIIIMELTYGASELNRKAETYWQAYFIGPVIEGVTMVAVLFYIEMERRKGFITSGVLFMYWFLANITYIIPFYTKIIEKGYSEEPLGFVLFNTYYVLSLIQLVLCCIVEKLPQPVGKAPCPESRASFLSMITFHWIQKLVITGYRKPLTEEDMFLLNTKDQTSCVLTKFESNWKKMEVKAEMNRLKSRVERNAYIQLDAGTSQNDTDISESTPLLRSTSKNSQSPDKPHDDGGSKDSKNRISLRKVLLKTFGWHLLLSQIWKLFYDVLMFVNPFLLRFLIDFAEDSLQPTWKGYVYGTGFFVVIVMQSVCFHALLNQSLTLGIQVRAVLIGAIFKKSLKMNNMARTESTIGEIVNYMSVDAEHIDDLMGYIWGVWSCPLNIILCLVFLYFTVGYAMFAGLGVMIILIPINAFFNGKVNTLQTQLMEQKDSRIKLMTEILNGIKILKLYAWEMAFGEKVSEIRKKELSMLLREQIIFSYFTFQWTVAHFVVSLATFATYIFMKEDHRFDPQTAFVAITLFNILRFSLNLAPMMVMEFVKALVSLTRIGKFLNHDDLDPTTVTHNPSDNAVSVENGTFTWDPNIAPCLNNINLEVPKGSLIAVVGTVGTGKSSLVSALLGEMQKITGTVNIDGTTGYVSQQAWIQNASLRDNILFGNDFDDRKYKTVLEACALQSDIDMLQAGDLTEIGEKGINLSGGQKQRVSVARAVYFDSDIYLLDDPLSAVDSHVGKHIFEKVIGKDGLLQNKTRILVTHGIHWLPAVDRIVVLNNGVISEVGSYEELLSHDGQFAKFLRTYLIEHEESDSGTDDDEAQEFKATILQRLVSIQSSEDPGSDVEILENRLLKRSRSHKESESDKGQGHEDRAAKKQVSVISEKSSNAGDSAKLIEEEELEVGNVNWRVYVVYAKALGVAYTMVIIVMFGLYQGFSVWSSIWLTNWTADKNLQNLSYWPANSTERREQNDYYLGVYGALGIAQGVTVQIHAVILAVRVVRAAKTLHHDMLINILRGPMSFFDTTPVGRIVNRFSQDIEAIDNTLPYMFVEVLFSLFNVLSVFIVVAYSTPIFLVAVVPMGLIYIMLQRFYIPTSRQLKRIESKTRSPIYNNFSESLAGVSTIRAFQVQDRFILESEKRVDFNQEYNFASNSANRWLGFRLDVLGGVVVLAASLFAVLERHNISSAIVGLSISYALQMTENLNWLVRMVSEFETNIVSVERVKQYTSNKTEAPLHSEYQPTPDWPSQGEVQLKSYSTRYRDGLPLVLKNIDVAVKPGEKVGIVGRTGAGKSSLTLSLFRLIEPSTGKILIDGENVSHLGLFDLRSRLTILPQEPVLFSGTLRVNLDPLGNHSDAALWTALEHAHLKSYIEGLPTQLEYEVGEGGQNLSVGQRQLMCLARSLLRKSKVLVLDEATAAVDLETDALIQKTISKEFQDCTVLTIAHRLNTVMDYDRILVLSDGEVKEFDSPQNLLQDTGSMFYSMAKDAGLA